MRDSLTIPPTTLTHGGKNQTPPAVFYSQHVTNRISANLLKTHPLQISTRNTFPKPHNHFFPTHRSLAPSHREGVPPLPCFLASLPCLHLDGHARRRSLFLSSASCTSFASFSSWNIATPLSRYFSRNSCSVNKSAKISRHVLRPCVSRFREAVRSRWPLACLPPHSQIDGHTVPSRNTANPSASTKVPELMATEFAHHPLLLTCHSLAPSRREPPTVAASLAIASPSLLLNSGPGGRKFGGLTWPAAGYGSGGPGGFPGANFPALSLSFSRQPDSYAGGALHLLK